MSESEEKKEWKRGWAHELPELIAGMAGAGASILLGAAGPFASVPIRMAARKAFTSVVDRFFAKESLSPQEKERVAAAMTIVGKTITRRIQDGEELREDGFFDSTGEARSDGEQIFEEVLMKCKDTPWDQKRPYLANFFVNISFTEAISAETAIVFLRLATELSYRQYCLLALVQKSDDLGFDTERLMSPTGDTATSTALRLDLEDLQSTSRYLLGNNHPQENFRVGKRRYFLTDMGQSFYDVLSLDGIDEDELKALASQFEELK